MSRLAALARFVFGEFGPLIAFWALALSLGVKPAIAGSILFIIADAAWRWRKRLAFTRLYLLVSVLTIVFGAIDLVSASPFMLKYEAAVTNVVTGLAFVVGAMGEKPIDPGSRGAARREPARDRRDPRVFSPVHARLGGLFFRQGRLLRLDRLDVPTASGHGGAVVCRFDQPRAHDRSQRRRRAGGSSFSAAASGCYRGPTLHRRK